MFALWRYDSLKVTIEAVEKNRKGAKAELYSLLAHYFVLFTVFPAVVWIPAVFMSGLVSALIVTPTHQSEEMFDEYQPDWVIAQFQSTRNAVTTNPFSEWIWGGMQYQLEHHLFPSMPRNKVSHSFQKDTLSPHHIIAQVSSCVPFRCALSSDTHSFLLLIVPQTETNHAKVR
jgi:fatty acid desaturase